MRQDRIFNSTITSSFDSLSSSLQVYITFTLSCRTSSLFHVDPPILVNCCRAHFVTLRSLTAVRYGNHQYNSTDCFPVLYVQNNQPHLPSSSIYFGSNGSITFTVTFIMDQPFASGHLLRPRPPIKTKSSTSPIVDSHQDNQRQNLTTTDQVLLRPPPPPNHSPYTSHLQWSRRRTSARERCWHHPWLRLWFPPHPLATLHRLQPRWQQSNRRGGGSSSSPLPIATAPQSIPQRDDRDTESTQERTATA